MENVAISQVGLAVVPFVHPGLALAAALAAFIPIVIHLINRRRHRRVRWAAMGFLLAANARSRRRLRFEHWTLLLLRTGAIVLFGLAAARPILSKSVLPSLGGASGHRILLIDNSLSACVTAGAAADKAGQPPAVAVALDLLGTFPTGDAVSAVALAAPADPVIAHAAFDRRTAREGVGSIPATQRSTDLAGGFAAAARILEESPAAPGDRTVYVISDQAASAWRADDEAAQAARRIADQAKLVLVPSTATERDNLSVTQLECVDSLPGTERPVRFRATVANFGGAAVQGAALQVRHTGRIVRRVPLDPLAPGDRQEVTFSSWQRTPGSQVIEVHLEAAPADALPEDDMRYLSIEVSEAVPVLLVDGRPDPNKFAGETGYLETAMAPELRAGRATLLAPKTITDLELPGQVLDDYRLIVLGNVQRLEEEVWHRLEAYVGSGGGLLIFAGDAVSPDNYNRFGYAEGKGLLPAALGSAVGDPSNRDAFVRLQPAAFTHPALADFAEAQRSGLFLKGRIYRFVPVEDEPTGTTVLLRYDNGLPAVLERSHGAGRVGLVTTSANMAWNNLAARGDYVSLIWGLASHLAGDPSAWRNLLIGQSIVQALTAAQATQPQQVTAPDGRATDARLDVSEGRCVLRCGPAEAAGSYTVATGTTPLHYAANVDPIESDLKVLDEAALGELLRCPFSYLPDPARIATAALATGSAEISRLLQYVVLLFLVYEAWLAMRFATRR